MKISNMTSKIKGAFVVSGYSRTAKELNKLSNEQLEDIGVSRDLLVKGAKAFPWRAESNTAAIPNNVTAFKTKQVISNTPIMPHTPKAA